MTEELEVPEDTLSGVFWKFQVTYPRASLWWQQHIRMIHGQGKTVIQKWGKMKALS